MQDFFESWLQFLSLKAAMPEIELSVQPQNKTLSKQLFPKPLSTDIQGEPLQSCCEQFCVEP